MMSWNSFSQNVTKDSLKVKTIQLTSPIARLVVKDLIKKDALSDEVQLMQSVLTSTNDKLLAQTDLLANVQVQNANLTFIVSQKDLQIKEYEKAKSDLEKALKKERATKKLYKIGSAIGAAAVLLNILK
jgi:hypothetical protein